MVSGIAMVMIESTVMTGVTRTGWAIDTETAENAVTPYQTAAPLLPNPIAPTIPGIRWMNRWNNRKIH